MGDSYRIKTEIGISQTIDLELTQDFEFLEILSLKIQQADIYNRNCADYGVIVGRVTANNGFGIPNARVSIFIPITTVDESNPAISSIYPYKSPEDKNEDGFRYNLLPYEKSYSKHAATGTFPSKNDVLTGKTAVEIYDKYYKFTTKTNDSGDYMIMGVPLGIQRVVMDVDLSDIGEFSLTPQDLIRMGRATQAQVAGNTFLTSNDLDSLPQLITIPKSLEISPLWGDPTTCAIAINRLDFDLKQEADIDIQPTSIFMGSVISTSNKYRVRKNAKPRDNMGNLCSLETGPGQIIALRQTIVQDIDGNPIIEQYQLEQNGNVIDGDGTWILELPMNLDYLTTNQFGERVISYDPTIGIPTKAKYRFKIKWQQSTSLTLESRRPIFIVPNVKEYGWVNSAADPYNSGSSSLEKQLASSYYFGLAWSGYTDGFVGTQKTNRLNEVINCEDTFYEFKFNRVYTVSGLIDQWKVGAKGRFIGIKEIDDDSCEDTINKFPVNDGFRNFDLLFFIFSILFTIIQFNLLGLLIVAHFAIGLYALVIGVICAICRIKIPIINVRPFGFICSVFRIKCSKKQYTIRLPMITYPECETCTCRDGKLLDEALLGGTNGVLSYVSDPSSYFNNVQSYVGARNREENVQTQSLLYVDAMAGNADEVENVGLFKVPKSSVQRLASDDNRYFAWSDGLTLGERINLFNSRDYYFDGLNKIKVTFNQPNNIGSFHYDNTITVLSNQSYQSGDLLTAVDPMTTTDINFLYTAMTANGIFQGITGTSVTGGQSITVNYASSQLSNTSVVYNLDTGTTINRQVYPMDREYFQVVTAITVSEAAKIWNSGTTQTFPNVLSKTHKLMLMRHRNFPLPGYEKIVEEFWSPYEFFDNMSEQFILILQRGVDPYSPKFTNQYSIGKILGLTENDITFTASTRLNIPIQKLNSNTTSVQVMNQSNTFYPSYFFTPGEFSGFTSSTVGYYGARDANNPSGNVRITQLNGVRSCVTTTSNNFQFGGGEDADKYSTSEDLSGGGYFYLNLDQEVGLWFEYSDVNISYKSPVLYPQFTGNPMSISVKTNNIFRNDRLPSSDQLNAISWDSAAVALLQQNNNFTFYTIPELENPEGIPGFTTGAQQVPPDIEDEIGAINVLESFNCKTMVSLNCYQGFGTSFQVNQRCTETDNVEIGCYLFMRRPFLDLFKDIKTLGEWGYRFRFFYALCRGVLSQSFMNNWMNGTLYQFPIQVDTRFNRLNKIQDVKYAKQLVFFDTKSNNFYYRSSPYNASQSKFVGRLSGPSSVNILNLMFPTTILNLGMKDTIWGEIIFEPDTRGYTISLLESTSYGDTSDLVNLFVISRITDGTVLGRIISLGDNSVNQLFSRNGKPDNISSGTARRIDGDLAQMLSINSEMGLIKYSPEYYESVAGNPQNPTNILGTPSNPVMAIWYSSTTEDLQFKDFLTPGRIDFRANPQSSAAPFTYGIKSQVVPLYRWKLANTTTIFGGQFNNWASGSADIVQNKPYQSLDRLSLTQPNYFRNSNTSVNEQSARGYIFSVDINGDYSKVGATSNNFIVGAPFQFYFGLIKGKSAIDKFKQKYSILE